MQIVNNEVYLFVEADGLLGAEEELRPFTSYRQLLKMIHSRVDFMRILAISLKLQVEPT